MPRLIARIAVALRLRWRVHRALATARRDTIDNLSRRPVGRILVVCYGNICRSPFAATYLAQAAGCRLQVRSSGIHRRAGRPSPPRHVAMSRQFGVDLSGHLSAVIGAEDVAWADIIVLMDRHNWQDLQMLGAPSDRLVWLGALDDGPVEIPDPYAMDEPSANQVLQRLQACSSHLASLLPPTTGDVGTASVSAPAGGGATPAS